MSKLSFYITFFYIIISVNIFAQSKIYLIRHAEVQIESPRWCRTNKIQTYKEEYNNAHIHTFDPEIVLNKIDFSETIDTIFCSPQLRALETADQLFNKQINLKINKNLMELDYAVISFPVLKLPAKLWQTISLISWMSGYNQEGKTTYKKRKQDLEIYANEIITYAKTHGKSVIVAHGVVNRELIKILKKKQWKFEQRDGYKNLAVNCLVK